MENKQRYNNLLAELKRANLTVKAVSDTIGVSVSAYYSRLYGTTNFRLDDMQKIQDLLERTTGQRYSLDYLFKYD